MQQRPEEIFREHGGQLRMSAVIGLGISRYMLYTLRDRGIIEAVSRGIYRLVELPPIGNPDLVTVSLRFPNAVICLVSALAYHDMTTQIPHEISVAILCNTRTPKLDQFPIRGYQFSKATYECGIEIHQIDGVPVKIYCREKTLADSFKFRHRIGMDIVLEALKLYRKHDKMDLIALQGYAKICRVERVIHPYLEAIV